jgi:hypothetical protein
MTSRRLKERIMGLFPSPSHRDLPHLDMGIDMPPFGRCTPSEIWEAWLFAQAEVELTYREWADALRAERGERYAAYRAALDREGQAAVVLKVAADAMAMAA